MLLYVFMLPSNSYLYMLGSFQIVLAANGQSHHYLTQIKNGSIRLRRCFKMLSIPLGGLVYGSVSHHAYYVIELMYLHALYLAKNYDHD